MNSNYELGSVFKLERDFISGFGGIPEPKKDNSTAAQALVLDQMVWLIPGVGFDGHGRRLGRGKGHYDRILQETRGTKIGIAYEWQIVQEIPVGQHDVYMDYIISDKQCLTCSSR